ncbi:hypothetical protein SARC_14770, partial [Sphaeroforma arctica JP610]
MFISRLGTNKGRITATPDEVIAVLGEIAALNNTYVLRWVLQRLRNFSPGRTVEPQYIRCLLDLPVSSKTAVADSFHLHVQLFKLCIRSNWEQEAYQVILSLREKQMVPTIHMINELLDVYVNLSSQ